LGAQDIFQDAENIYVVMDHLEYGDLLTFYNNRKQDPLNGQLTEEETRYIVRKLFEALAYLHEDIKSTHRDIKPTHLLFADEERLSIKLSGFGNATYNVSDLSGDSGTLQYLAPEIIKGRQYDSKVDIWSAGVMSYFLLTDRQPFGDKSSSYHQLKLAIKNHQLSFEGEEWSNVTDEAKGFLKLALTKDPQKRPTARELLEDVWLANAVTPRRPGRLVDPTTPTPRFASKSFSPKYTSFD